MMENAIIAFVSVFLLGVVIYVSVWWEGSYFSLAFTKWFFIIFFVVALVSGGATYVMGN